MMVTAIYGEVIFAYKATIGSTHADLPIVGIVFHIHG